MSTDSSAILTTDDVTTVAEVVVVVVTEDVSSMCFSMTSSRNSSSSACMSVSLPMSLECCSTRRSSDTRTSASASGEICSARAFAFGSRSSTNSLATLVAASCLSRSS